MIKLIEKITLSDGKTKEQNMLFRSRNHLTKQMKKSATLSSYEIYQLIKHGEVIIDKENWQTILKIEDVQ